MADTPVSQLPTVRIYLDRAAAAQLRGRATLPRKSGIVRSLREQLRISQEELGCRSDLDRTYVSGVEPGVRNPTLMVLARLATALDVEPSVLLAYRKAD